MNLHPSQRKLLNAIRRKPDASIRELQRMSGISSTSVADYHLTKMMAAGIIRKVNEYEILIEPGM